MNIGQVYASRKNFKSIKYARSEVTDREYVRIRDIFGKAVTIEITGDDLEKVLSDMCRVILMGEEKIAPPACVTDTDTLRKISPLFT